MALTISIVSSTRTLTNTVGVVPSALEQWVCFWLPLLINYMCVLTRWLIISVFRFVLWGGIGIRSLVGQWHALCLWWNHPKLGKMKKKLDYC